GAEEYSFAENIHDVTLLEKWSLKSRKTPALAVDDLRQGCQMTNDEFHKTTAPVKEVSRSANHFPAASAVVMHSSRSAKSCGASPASKPSGINDCPWLCIRVMF